MKSIDEENLESARINQLKMRVWWGRISRIRTRMRIIIKP